MKTTAYLLAEHPACVKVRDEEIRVVRRRIEPLAPRALPSLAPTGSWLLGALLGPGDDTASLSGWRRPQAVAADRVRFYVLPRTDLHLALRSWVAAGLPPPLVAEVRDFASFHKVFGKHLNDRVWLDFR